MVREMRYLIYSKKNKARMKMYSWRECNLKVLKEYARMNESSMYAKVPNNIDILYF